MENQMVEGTTATMTSPRNRLKLLCCLGGTIVPRPKDGKFKYVGGDSRVLAFPRSVSFSEMKEKITSNYNADLAIKYQLMPEHLDVLVTVKTDEDVYHMIDEYDHQESESPRVSPRFRLFLFPTNSSSSNTSRVVPNLFPLERRYMEAINCIRIPTGNTNGSPTSTTTTTTNCSFRRMQTMQKAHSFPDLQAMGRHHHHPTHERSAYPRHNPIPGLTCRMGSVPRGVPFDRCVSEISLVSIPRQPSMRFHHRQSGTYMGNGGGACFSCHVDDSCCMLATPGERTRYFGGFGCA